LLISPLESILYQKTQLDIQAVMVLLGLRFRGVFKVWLQPQAKRVDSSRFHTFLLDDFTV
jgi:hypothetical protein